MDDNILVFFVACVMPVAIFLLISLSSMHKDKLRAKILIKAIESHGDFDADKLAEALQKPKKTPLDVLYKRLLCGCIFTLIGFFSGVIFVLCAHKMNVPSAVVSFLIATTCLAIGLGCLITYFVTRKQVITGAKKDKEKVSNSQQS